MVSAPTRRCGLKLTRFRIRSDYLPLSPHSKWTYSFARGDHGDNFTESWNGAVELEIAEVACGKDSAQYSVHEMFSVRHRLIVHSYGADDYVQSDTAQGTAEYTLKEYPDGALAGASFKYVGFDLDRRYHEVSPDSTVETNVPASNYRTRVQKYKAGVGLIQSDAYPAPYLGFTSSSSLRLQNYSVPDMD